MGYLDKQINIIKPHIESQVIARSIIAKRLTYKINYLFTKSFYIHDTQWSRQFTCSNLFLEKTKLYLFTEKMIGSKENWHTIYNKDITFYGLRYFRSYSKSPRHSWYHKSSLNNSKIVTN